MKVTWTNPGQIPAIQRWGVLPVVFALAGAAGGSAGYSLGVLVARSGISGHVALEWTVIQGCLCLGVGFAVLFPGPPWIRWLAGPFLGAPSFFLAVVCHEAFEGRFSPVEIWSFFSQARVWFFVAVQPMLLIAAHLLYLRRVSTALRILAYVGAGAAWGGLLRLTGDTHSFYDPNEFVQGVLMGLLQWAGMAAAQAFSGVRASAPGPGEAARTPSS